METRTVILPVCDFDEYVEYLASEAWPIVRSRERDNGRLIEVTFAIA